ncbi:MAG TPA: OmpA family protein, partial [Gammaproteobacteria bacterium]
IESTGSVALYGILFDSDRATLRQESRPTLDEIAKLLKGEPKLKLLVVGHTDNVGSFTYNMDLSRQRAEAVAAELTHRYGIAASRLHPVGISFASPVASNRSEEGRARNRRVELVED